MSNVQRPSVEELQRIAKELENDLGKMSVTNWKKRAIATVDGMNLDDAKKVYQTLEAKQRKDIRHLEQQAADLMGTTKLFRKGKTASSSNTGVIQGLPDNEWDGVGAGCGFVVKTSQTAKGSLPKHTVKTGNIVEEAMKKWKGVKKTMTRYLGIAGDDGDRVAAEAADSDEE